MRNKETNAPDCASVWFLRLERAKNLNDFAAAAEAVQQLKAIGVMVKLAPKSPAKREVAPC